LAPFPPEPLILLFFTLPNFYLAKNPAWEPQWYAKFIHLFLFDELDPTGVDVTTEAFNWVATHRGYELWQLCCQFLASPSRAGNLHISEHHYAYVWSAMVTRLQDLSLVITGLTVFNIPDL